MKVVHIIKATGLAGAEKHLLILLTGLRRAGVEASLIILTNPGNTVDDFYNQARERGIPVERITINSHFDLTVSFHLCGLMMTVKPDIVHTHLIHGDLFGALAARMARVAHVVTTRHNDDRFRFRLWFRVINRLLWSTTAAGITVSDYLNFFTRNVERVPAKLIQTVHHGIEIEPDETDPEVTGQRRQRTRRELGYDQEQVVIAVVGRLARQKGVIYALQAFRNVARENPGACLLVIGDGPQRDELLKEVRAGVSAGDFDASRVQFIGWRADVPRLLVAVDLLLVPSLHEGFGLVLLEAMAARLPIVATDISAIPEVVDSGKTGLLVPPRDPVAMARAINTLTADRGLRVSLGEAGRQRLLAMFSLESMISKTKAVYDKLPSGSKPASALAPPAIEPESGAPTS